MRSKYCYRNWLLAILACFLTLNASAQQPPAGMKYVPSGQTCYTPKPAVPAKVTGVQLGMNNIPVLFVGEPIIVDPKVHWTNRKLTDDYSATSSDNSGFEAQMLANAGIRLTGFKPGNYTLTLTPDKDPSKMLTLPVVVKDRANIAGVDPKDKNALLAALHALGFSCGNDGGISPWWLLLLLLIPAGWLLGRRTHQQEIDQVDSNARIAEQNRMQGLVDEANARTIAANARADEAIRQSVRHQIDNDVMRERMADFNARVEARTAELNRELTAANARVETLTQQNAQLRDQIAQLRNQLDTYAAPIREMQETLRRLEETAAGPQPEEPAADAAPAPAGR